MEGGALSDLLLDLYRYARELTLSEFQGRVLARLQAALSFDSAWWGVSRQDHLIHCSFPYGLPAEYQDFYQAHVAATDTLAEAALARTDRGIRFGPKDFARSPGLSLLTRHFGIRQSLTVVRVTPTLNLVMFISLYRRNARPAYTEAERQAAEWVMPHLWATWTANWIAQMKHIRADSAAQRIGHAVADAAGVLHSAEPRFLALLQMEWPDWDGPILPAELKRALLRQEGYCGRRLELRSFHATGLSLLEARMRSALDALSPRERTVAEAFGAGRSYKEIAARLNLSPATVRHYLRRIYSKANVSNKAALAQLIGTSS